MRDMRQAIATVAVIAVFGALGTMSARTQVFSRIPRIEVEITRPVSAERLRERRDAREGGWEMLLVYIGSYSCGYCQNDTTRLAVQRADALLSERLARSGMSFRRLGVDVDSDPREGWHYLSRILEFDEVLVGSQWANAGAVRYVWQDHPAHAVIPQMLLVRRRLRAEDAYGRSLIKIEDEEVLQRLMGMNEMFSWANDQLPVVLEAYLQDATSSEEAGE